MCVCVILVVTTSTLPTVPLRRSLTLISWRDLCLCFSGVTICPRQCLPQPKNCGTTHTHSHMQTAMINTASVPMSSSYHHQHHHHHQSPYYLMTPTRTRRGLAAAAADVGSAKSKTPSPVVGRRSGGREIPQHQQSRLAHHHADFIFSIEYDLFLKNLVGIDQASCSSTSSSPPSGAGYYHRASGGKGELWHSASFSPQSLPKARSHRPQSSSFAFPYHQQYYHQQQHQQFKRASHSLSSSASSSTSSPTRRPQPAPAAVPAQSIVQQPQSDNALNIEKKETAADVEIDEIEPENLSHQHLHALHRFRRQRDKGKRWCW